MLRDLIDRLSNHLYAPVSFEHGFNNLTVAEKLPASHQQWEDCVAKLADYIATFKVQAVLAELPVLPANSEALPEAYLLRASIIISGFAHAYYYPGGYKADKLLPESILHPLEEIAQRINKRFDIERDGKTKTVTYTGRTYIEDFLANWVFSDNQTGPSISLANTKTLASYFNNQEEFVSSMVTGPLMQAAFVPVLSCMATIEEELIQEKPNNKLIAEQLSKITVSLKAVQKAFNRMSPLLKSRSYVDQVIWPQTSPSMGKAHPNEMPNTGVDSPIFHVMDGLINRKKRETTMGKNIITRFNAVPDNFQQVIYAARDIGERLASYMQQSTDLTLNMAFTDMVSYYTGPNGLLDVHRRKAYGYLKLSFLAGRLQTNAAVTGVANTLGGKGGRQTPWARVNDTFLRGMEERLASMPILTLPPPALAQAPVDSSTANRQQQIYPHQIALYNRPDESYCVFQDGLYDMTDFIKKHPGGHRIIQSLAGSDFEKELSQAHYYELGRIVASMQKYRIGQVVYPQITASEQKILDKWTHVGSLIATVQNNILGIWRFDSKEVNDNARQIPYQFVKKTLALILEQEGYVDSLLFVISPAIQANYRDEILSTLILNDGPSVRLKPPTLFSEIGSIVMRMGEDEIRRNGSQTVSDTFVKQLRVYALFDSIINKTQGMLETLKQQIVLRLDEQVSSNEPWLSLDEQLKEITKAELATFVNSVDSSQTQQLIDEVTMPSSVSFSANTMLTMFSHPALKKGVGLLLALVSLTYLASNDENPTACVSGLAVSIAALTIGHHYGLFNKQTLQAGTSSVQTTVENNPAPS